MKVRITLDVDEYERFVIARYFGAAAADQKDRARPRATRAQCRRFARAAVRSMVREQAAGLYGRARTTAQRLLDPAPVTEKEHIVHGPEYQPSLGY